MKKTVGILTFERVGNRPLNSVGSSRIRARWLLNYWPEAEEYRIGREYAVMVFQKVYFDSLKEKANYRGIKIIDLCDPDWLEGKPVFEFIDWADAVTTSTEALADYIRKLRPKALVRCVPDRVYIPEHKPVKKIHKGPLRKVCWFGYYHNAHYLVRTFDHLVKRNIRLEIISSAPYDPPTAYRGKLVYKNTPYSYGTIFRTIARNDAVLMPKPIGDEKGKYKSDNKITQSKAQGMPVIVEPEDLDKFMDPKEREKASLEGLKEVKEKHDVKISVDEMRELIEEIKKRRKDGKSKGKDK